MFEYEQQLIEICLLKSNLDSTENDIVAQRSAALPALEASKQKYVEAKSDLKNMRAMSTEIERLNLKSMQLTAQRVQLKHQIDNIFMNLEPARQYRDNLLGSLKEEEQEVELLIRKYEGSLRVKAERFRKTHEYYNEEKINTEIDKENSVIAELKDGMSQKQSVVDGLRAQMDAIHSTIAENLLEIVGKTDLEGKVKVLTEKYEQIQEKQKTSLKQN